MAVTKARNRLRLAAEAVALIETCDNHQRFMDLWYTFLLASKNVHTQLEQGAKKSPRSRQWFGNKKAFRRKDELLQYVYQARNDDEHGVTAVATLVPLNIDLPNPKEGMSQRLKITNTGEHVVIESLDGMPLDQITHTPPYPVLARVYDRSGKPYDPPQTHLGQRLPSALPIDVARLTISYLSSLIDEASALEVA